MEDRRTFSKKDGCREKPHHTICSLLYGQDSASLSALGASNVPIGFLSVAACGTSRAPACASQVNEANKIAIAWHFLLLC
jgi:hypothetical protein